VPIIGGDFDQEALAKVLDHVALNQAAASLYRDRFDSTPASSAAGVDHYNLAGNSAQPGRPRQSAAARRPSGWPRSGRLQRGEIDVLVNAMLSPRVGTHRATV
jgi:hypothetical protein